MKLIVKGLIGALVNTAILAALLFIPAGTLNWPRAILFFIVYGVIGLILVVVLARVAPASLEARLQGPIARSQPVADRIVTALHGESALPGRSLDLVTSGRAGCRSRAQSIAGFRGFV